ncbi:transport permease protein [Actinomadura sp. NBRC 104425]|uniref:ABC transporter permease n=1 Tax=Actinomadura sp. NBRC 104425 TaxID=3032204 RepID=UPI0024A16C29|nr:ABC transporter permease [Actinomadura sp. NBRC 104425]GLZ12883.1 transport permease protein [Actinomadura sp. NBRC 104425]
MTAIEHDAGPARALTATVARDLRVMRRSLVSSVIRIVLQPLLFAFVFAYVLPEAGLMGRGTVPGDAAGDTPFSTILVPGLVGSTVITQSLMAVVFPLVMELTPPSSIEDRLLAPLPVRMIALQKIGSAMVQGLIGGLLVFPAVLLVHAEGQAPDVRVDDGILLAAVVLLGALTASAAGLLLGTLLKPQQTQVLFTVVMLPAIMLGCVYFPWEALDEVRWLQAVVLADPIVYMNEGLRAALTPQVAHMPTWVVLPVLGVLAAALTALSVRVFTRKVAK